MTQVYGPDAGDGYRIAQEVRLVLALAGGALCGAAVVGMVWFGAWILS